MKKVIVLPNVIKDPDFLVTFKLIRWLFSLKFDVYIPSIFKIPECEGIHYYSDIPKDVDFILVVGGDGSVIEASKVAILLDVPLLGINVGRIGYLSEVEPDNFDVLNNLAKGNYTVEKKMLLVSEHISTNGSIVKSERLAVNDVVISQDGYFGIADFDVISGRGERVSYRGNGVILATPVGSTAYSLSAGGPVISHNLESIIVTPVCPHSFFNRAIVYGPDEVIDVSNTGEMDLNISIDGRSFTVLKRGEVCRVYTSEHKLKMITFNENNMLSTLFEKIRTFGNKV